MTPKKQKMIALAFLLAQSPLVMGQEMSTELYGDFRYSVNRAGTGEDSRWAGANNASRLGVRGEASGQHLTAFFDFQVGVNIDAEQVDGAFTQRYYFAGVRGAFGSLTVGRHSTAYKMAGLRQDPFYDTSTLSASGGVPDRGLFAGASFGLSNLTNGFADRAVAYTSPGLGGITANAAAYIDTNNDHGSGFGIAYRGNGIDTGLQYHHAGGGQTWPPAVGIGHGIRAHAAYAQAGAWSARASFERVETATDAVQAFIYASATLNVTPRVQLAGAVGHVDDAGIAEMLAGTGYHVGALCTLIQPLRLHILYSRLHPDTGSTRDNMVLGLTLPFSHKD